MSVKAIQLETDYLVIGAGAMSLAFVDELINNSNGIKVILVDKRAKPGGHWVDAYDFVRLHAPSSTYGVNSKVLGTGEADLSSKAQILAYYESVLKDLLATGRVSVYMQCEYTGNGGFRSLVAENLTYDVQVKKKVVDGTIHTADIPATKQPAYKITEGVKLVPINDLTHLQEPWKRYVVIGGGKTGIDAILFLLEREVDPDHITWIVPNDSWFLNRQCVKAESIHELIPSWNQCAVNAKNIDDYYLKMESAGIILRMDKNIWPMRMRLATVSLEELEKMSLVKNIIRIGRVEHIDATSIVFQQGEKIPNDPGALHIDCTASAIDSFDTPVCPVFEGNKINLRFILPPPPGYNASVIAGAEIHLGDDEEKKNSMCKPYQISGMPWDFSTVFYVASVNGAEIGKSLGIRWIRQRRTGPLKHIPLYGIAQVMFQGYRYKDIIEKKHQQFVAEGMNGKYGTFL